MQVSYASGRSLHVRVTQTLRLINKKLDPIRNRVQRYIFLTYKPNFKGLKKVFGYYWICSLMMLQILGARRS